MQIKWPRGAVRGLSSILHDVLKVNDQTFEKEYLGASLKAEKPRLTSEIVGTTPV
jgi:hypothetical protein